MSLLDLLDEEAIRNARAEEAERAVAERLRRRDLFAAAALAGWIIKGYDYSPNTIAQLAWDFAQAMFETEPPLAS